MPFMSRILWAKQSRKIKEHKYVFNGYCWFEITYTLELCGLNSPK